LRVFYHSCRIGEEFESSISDGGEELGVGGVSQLHIERPVLAAAVYLARTAEFKVNLSQSETILGLFEGLEALESPGGFGLGHEKAVRRVLAAANAPENKEVLKRQTEEAGSRGLFGAPSFTVGDELFWGNDRLEAALAWAKRA